MTVPSMFTGNRPFDLLKGTVVGVVLTLAVGFNWLGFGAGWMQKAAVQKLVTQRTNDLAVVLYTPTCVQRFEQQANVTAQWAVFKDQKWSQDTWLREKGFATLPGADYPNTPVSEACAKKLADILEKMEPQAKN